MAVQDLYAWHGTDDPTEQETCPTRRPCGLYGSHMSYIIIDPTDPTLPTDHTDHISALNDLDRHEVGIGDLSDLLQVDCSYHRCMRVLIQKASGSLL